MKTFEIERFGIDNLRLLDQPIPEPGHGEVLVRLRAASLNYRDLMVASGTYNPRMKLPAIPLSDGAGEVAAVGPGVSRWKAEDRVMPIFVQRWFAGPPDLAAMRTALGGGAHWNGTLREFAVFDERSLVRVPAHLSFEEAATLPCAAVTAWHALAVSGRLRAGETVLTLGTGGVSIFAAQIARLFGARVIATTSSEEKAERLRLLGAAVINYREREDWDAAVLEATAKTGVDHVVEVGGAGTLQRSINAVRVGGHIALIGALDAEGDFSYVPIFMKAIRLQGIFVGSKQMFEDLVRAIEVAELRPVIDRVFGFDEAPQAMHYMQSGKHFGKVVIKY